MAPDAATRPEHSESSTADETARALAISSLSLARRFHRGATLWCCAPSWTHHAHHLAVEFVHPVIVGKRALPAVAVVDKDPIGVIRSLARRGDALVVVADGADPVARDLMRRAEAWGIGRWWIGAGPRPGSGETDHVLWTHGDAADANLGGAIVRMYHVLWELTHVCFEHPGLLEVSDSDCDDEVCITCSDEGRVAEVDRCDDDGMATVRTARGTELVDAALVMPVEFGDLLLIHAGLAINRIDHV